MFVDVNAINRTVNRIAGVCVFDTVQSPNNCCQLNDNRNISDDEVFKFMPFHIMDLWLSSILFLSWVLLLLFLVFLDRKKHIKTRSLHLFITKNKLSVKSQNWLILYTAIVSESQEKRMREWWNRSTIHIRIQ